MSRRLACLLIVFAAGLPPGPARGAAPPEPRTLKGHTGWVGGVAFSPDGETLATACADKTVKLWDVETGKELATLTGHTDYVAAVAFSPDGKTLATGSYDHTAKLWDAASGAELLRLKGHSGAVLSVAFSPDGGHVGTAGIDGVVRLWDPATGREAATLRGHKSWVNAVAWTPDGKSVASAGSDGTLHLGSGLDVSVIQPKAAELRSLAFSPDGKLLAVGTRYGLVKVYEVATEKEVATLKGRHGGDVWGVAFSPDGKALATADGDWNKPSDVVLWDTATWKERARLAHTNEVLCVAFHPKKTILAAGAWDKTVRVWDVTELLKADR